MTEPRNPEPGPGPVDAAPSADPEQALTDLLQDALRDRLGTSPVDVTALLGRTRRRARQARVRRRVTLAAACTASVGTAAVIAPGAVARLQAVNGTASVASAPEPTPGGRRSPVTLTTTPSPTSSASPSPTPVPTPVPTPGPTADPEQRRVYAEGVAYPIPDTVAFRQSDFPRPLTVFGFDSGQYRLQPTVPGQSCQDPSLHGVDPVAGRQWSWSEKSSSAWPLTVDLVVTGWAAGTGPARFQDVLHDRGKCRWLVPQRAAFLDTPTGDDSWAGSQVSNGLTAGHALVRIGDVLVGVEVYDPAGRAAALTLAERLARTAAGRVQAGHVGTADAAS